MHIGVVTPAYNVAPFIGAAIRSVLAQTYDNWSMVIVDDGSADGTAEVVRGFQDRRLRLVRQPNAGVSAARNHGVACLDADAFLFLDADDRLSRFATAELAAALRGSPSAVASFGTYRRDAGTAGAGADDVTAPGWRRAIGPSHPPEDMLEQLLLRNRFVNGGHLLISKRAIRLAGAFRSDLTYGEDWEYWIRLAMHGKFVRVRDRRPVLHVHSRPDGAYRRMAADPRCFDACMEAIFTNPDLESRLGRDRVRRARRRAEAENAWIVGREMIRHGRQKDGRRWLIASVRAAPSAKRLGLTCAAQIAAWLPARWRGPFRPYIAAA